MIKHPLDSIRDCSHRSGTICDCAKEEQPACIIFTRSIRSFEDLLCNLYPGMVVFKPSPRYSVIWKRLFTLLKNDRM